MRRPGLATWVVLVVATIVTAAVALVGARAAGTARRFAHRQALARVEVGLTGARDALERVRRDVEVAARLLAERPTLDALVGRDDRPGLTAFLDAFARTGRLAACAVRRNGTTIAAGGAAVDWDAVAASIPAGGGSAAVASPPDRLALAALAELADRPSTRVLALVVPDASWERTISHQLGVDVAVLSRATAVEESRDPRAPVRLDALEGGTSGAIRVEPAAAYVAAAPVPGPDGGIAGVVEASLPASVVDRSVRSLRRDVAATAAVVGALALLAGLVLARRIVRPLGALTESAARIGGGDLVSPVPYDAPGEVGALATAMEEMRDRILHLTTELRRRRAEAEAIVAGIADGVFSVDRERRLRFTNAQAAALLGVDPAGAVGRFCGDVLRPRLSGGGRPCEDRCPILDARVRGRARATEHLFPEGGGRRVVVITSASSAPEDPNARGEPEQFQVVRDETETEAARRLRDTVLANVSHEFKTPLSAQLASIEILKDRLADLRPEEVEHLVRSLERGALRLTRLIDNLLESTRIEAGRDTIRRRRVALDEVVEEASELMRPLLEQRDQRLEVDLPYPLPAITGDAERLTQVVVNLVANAHKFAPDASAIRIAGEFDDHEVRVAVEDRGPGIAGGATSSLFERFARSPGEEPEQGGMGLGLWIVKSIVDRHGGRVEVDTGPGGTRVVVALPRESER